MPPSLTNNDGYSPPCPKCTAANGAHSLRCPVVNLPANWAEMEPRERYGS